MLTVNVRDLLQQSAAERAEHAGKLRDRLQELQTKLGVRPPVYVLVTMADLLAGFTETFDALSREERDQVWGFTFSQIEVTSGEATLQAFDTQYRALEDRLNAGQLDRLQAERDLSKAGCDLRVSAGVRQFQTGVKRLPEAGVCGRGQSPGQGSAQGRLLHQRHARRHRHLIG